jgi:hypothetical protein
LFAATAVGAVGDDGGLADEPLQPASAAVASNAAEAGTAKRRLRCMGSWPLSGPSDGLRSPR